MFEYSNYGESTELQRLTFSFHWMHMARNCFYSLVGMKRQKRSFQISFEFRTFYANAVLLYNGRYSNQNDFVAVEIVDGQVHFSVSFGKKTVEKVTTVQSFVAGGVNDGKWHVVKVKLQDKVGLFLFFNVFGLFIQYRSSC